MNEAPRQRRPSWLGNVVRGVRFVDDEPDLQDAADAPPSTTFDDSSLADLGERCASSPLIVDQVRSLQREVAMERGKRWPLRGDYDW